MFDWIPAGEGTRLAVAWLSGKGALELPLWGHLVQLVGKNVYLLTLLSVSAALLCATLIAFIFNNVFGLAIWLAAEKGSGEKNEFTTFKRVAITLVVFSFLFTPAIMVGATRLSPLLFVLLPIFAAISLIVRVVCFAAGAMPLIDRLVRGKWQVLLALLLLGYSTFELIFTQHSFLSQIIRAVWPWLVFGVVPTILIANSISNRIIVGKVIQMAVLGVWSVVVIVTEIGVMSLGAFVKDRVSWEIAVQIVENAKESGKVAIVSDGTLDELYYFLLPKEIRLISFAHDKDPKYGRELASWVSVDIPRFEGSETLVEDLSFAAELGPMTLVDEWCVLNRESFDRLVAYWASFFPTREKWEKGVAALKNVRGDSQGKRLRHYLAVSGNALGCRILERGGNEEDAWKIFKTIVDQVEPENYGAFLNLHGMTNRGYTASEDEVVDLENRRKTLESELGQGAQILHAVRTSGCIYMDQEVLSKYERLKRECVSSEFSEEAKEFVEKIIAATTGPEKGRIAQEAIHKAIAEGNVKADVIGGELIAIDLSLGDFDNAERDAIKVLRLNRHDPTANAALGVIVGRLGDFERAERYLRRAVDTGKASAAAKNDLAWVLSKRGKLEEAELLARESVQAFGDIWAFRETLASILIREGKLEEGERELKLAEKLALGNGSLNSKPTSIVIDYARLYKAKCDIARFNASIRILQWRKNLSDEQKAEIGELGSTF